MGCIMQSAGVCARECVFTGNGFSNELEGGKFAGMKAIQAKWYTSQFPYKRESMDGFFIAEEPLDILQYIESHRQKSCLPMSPSF